MVEHYLAKVITRVRFPPLAPVDNKTTDDRGFFITTTVGIEKGKPQRPALQLLSNEHQIKNNADSNSA